MSDDKKKAAKACKSCGKPIDFPGWFLSKAKLCAVCIAKVKLAEELKRGKK